MVRRIAVTALASVAFGLGLAQLASATELAPAPRHAPKAPRQAAAPPPAPAPAPASSPNYTGFYAGGNGGGGFENTINNSVSSCSGFFCSADHIPGAVPAQLNTRPSGFIGGGQIGYNWQTGLFVWGVETDFQGANITGSATATNSSEFATVTGAGSQKIDWFGTLRGRLGWTPTPPLLIYATGGLAYGQVKTNVSFTGFDCLISFCSNFASGATAVTKTDTRAGWTVGGGAEWMFAPQWSVKAEYLFYDLGTVGIDQTLNTFNGSFLETSTSIHSDARYRGSIVRGGVNFHFY